MFCFEQALSQIEPYHCTIQKSIGGHLPAFENIVTDNCNGNPELCADWPHFDGVKNICLDQLYPAILSGSCLVYSFGIAEDWTFEEMIAKLGCKVD